MGMCRDSIKSLKQFWSLPAAFFLALWFWLLVAGEQKFSRDPGILWHVVVGEQILSTGQRNRTEIRCNRRGRNQRLPCLLWELFLLTP